MSLKTNYKNDKFSGMRKYRVTNNSDETISLEDVTEYQEIGDIFNADDINATNAAVNQALEDFQNLSESVSSDIQNIKNSNAEFQSQINQTVSGIQSTVDSLKSAKTATLKAASWSASSPYTQKVSVSGIQSSDTPIIGFYISGSPTASDVKTKRKAFGYIDRAVTSDGSITFYCYEKKPGTDFMVQIKGE